MTRGVDREMRRDRSLRPATASLADGDVRMDSASASRSEHSGVALAIARMLGAVLAAVLLVGLIRGATTLGQSSASLDSLQIESFGLLGAAVGSSGSTRLADGRPAPAAVVVLVRSGNADGAVASGVRVWAAPASSFGGHQVLATVPVVSAGQTVAVILPCPKPTGPYSVRVAVGKWSHPTGGGAPLPAVHWARGVQGTQVQVANPSEQEAPGTTLVAAFFNRNGTIVGAGQRSIPRLPPGGSWAATVPVAFGTYTASAHVAVFEERT